MGHFTTPEAPEVYAFLREAADRGLKSAVLEVSSHALALKRVEGLTFRVGVFVNFYPDDHLDFHGTAEAYFRAKALLVERSDLAVLARSLPHFPRLAQRPHLSFGEGGEVYAEGLRETPEGLAFRLHTPWGSGEAFLPLLGAYNLENALAASAAALALGVGAGRCWRASPPSPGCRAGWRWSSRPPSAWSLTSPTPGRAWRPP